MEPTSRRSFARGLGLLGLLSVGVAGYKEVTSAPTIVYKQDELPTKELEAQLEGPGVSSIQMMATYGEILPPEKLYGTNSYYYFGVGPKYKPGTEKQVSVKLIPGPDGKLYVKENDTWRKI